MALLEERSFRQEEEEGHQEGRNYLLQVVGEQTWMVLVPVVLRLVVVVLPCSCWPFLDSAAAEVVVEQILPACLEEAVGNLGQVVAVVLVEAESYLRQVEAEEGNRLDQVVEGSGSLNYCRRALRRCNADGKAPKTDNGNDGGGLD